MNNIIVLGMIVATIYVAFIYLCIDMYSREKKRVERNKEYNKINGKEILNTSMTNCYLQIIFYIIYINTLLYVLIMK